MENKPSPARLSRLVGRGFYYRNLITVVLAMYFTGWLLGAQDAQTWMAMVFSYPVGFIYALYLMGREAPNSLLAGDARPNSGLGGETGGEGA